MCEYIRSPYSEVNLALKWREPIKCLTEYRAPADLPRYVAGVPRQVDYTVFQKPKKCAGKR